LSALEILENSDATMPSSTNTLLRQAADLIPLAGMLPWDDGCEWESTTFFQTGGLLQSHFLRIVLHAFQTDLQGL